MFNDDFFGKRFGSAKPQLEYDADGWRKHPDKPGWKIHRDGRLQAPGANYVAPVTSAKDPPYKPFQGDEWSKPEPAAAVNVTVSSTAAHVSISDGFREMVVRAIVEGTRGRQL